MEIGDSALSRSKLAFAAGLWVTSPEDGKLIRSGWRRRVLGTCLRRNLFKLFNTPISSCLEEAAKYFCFESDLKIIIIVQSLVRNCARPVVFNLGHLSFHRFPESLQISMELETGPDEDKDGIPSELC